MQLRDKVVLITGASEGIGAACVTAFARRGSLLSITARNEHKLRAAAPDAGVITAGDLTEESTRRRVVETTMARYGRIDVLVNNAGVGTYETAHSGPLDSTRRMFELNFFAALDMIQLVSPYMKEQGSGAIVNVSSIAGKITLPWFTAYSASKAALCSITEGIRTELSRDGIHVMAVCPGYVQTGFQQHVLTGRPPELVGRLRRWAVTAEQCAEDLVRGVERDAKTVVTPWSGWLLIAASRFAPSLVERQFANVYFSDHGGARGAQAAP
jgi:short-subunit dehydrogenase